MSEKNTENEEDYQSDIRHDLRNKLQIIQGYLSLLEEMDFSEEPKKYIKKSQNAANSAQDLLEKWKEIQYQEEDSE